MLIFVPYENFSTLKINQTTVVTACVTIVTGYCIDTTFLIGLLSSVESLSLTVGNSTLLLTWTAPFSLDIEDADPDIEYCVDVATPTFSLTRMCRIRVTEFSYPLPPGRVCDNIMFTVTPVNVVGNGKQANISISGERKNNCVVVAAMSYGACVSAPQLQRVVTVPVSVRDLPPDSCRSVPNYTLIMVTIKNSVPSS